MCVSPVPRCKICPLTFFSKSDMQIHSKTHTEAKAHKCPHCTKSFANASYLAQHLRIHLGVKPYRCSYCEKCFRQLSHLQQHTRSSISDFIPYSLFGFYSSSTEDLKSITTFLATMPVFSVSESTQENDHINVPIPDVEKLLLSCRIYR